MYIYLRAQTTTPIQTVADSKDSITSLQVTEHEILSSGVDGHIRNYDIRAGSCIIDRVGRT